MAKNFSPGKGRPREIPHKSKCTQVSLKAGFHMIADDRGSQIAESSAIVSDHMETHFCNPAIVVADDRRR